MSEFDDYSEVYADGSKTDNGVGAVFQDLEIM